MANIDSCAETVPLGCLRAGLKLYVEFGVSRPDHYTVTFLHGPKSGRGQAFDGSIAGPAFDTFRQAVRACVEHGDIRPADADMTAQALWASVHGLTALFITAKGFPLVAQEALVNHTVDILIAGLRAPAPPARTPVAPPSRPSTFID